jgi:iron complex outermembrane receptor protein
MFNKSSLAMAIAVGIVFNTSAYSQVDNASTIEEVIILGQLSRYSAIKSDTPILETARSVSIKTLDDLVNIGALELADAYTYSAGVTGETFGFATRGDYLRVRGLDVPQYQDSLQSLFGDYNNTRTEIYTLEQVEILKGPASVLYGQGSPGGIVNTVSKRPNSDAQSEVTASFGNYDYQQFGADLNGQLDQDGKWLYRIVGLYRNTETQVDFVEDNVQLIAPSISYLPNDKTEFSLLLNYQQSEADAGAQFLPIAGTLNPAPNGQYIDSDFNAGDPSFSEYDGKTQSVTLLANHQFNETWSVEATARHTEGDRDYEQAWVAFSFSADRYVNNADGSLYKNGSVPRTFYQSEAESEQTAADIRFRANFETANFEHSVMIGGQYQNVTTDDDNSYAYALGYNFLTGAPDTTFGDQYWINVFAPEYGNIPSQDIIDSFFVDMPENKVKDLGVYINDQITFDNWHLNAGIRLDEVTTDNGINSQDDSATSFSAGLLYAFDNGLSPYISYAESFEPVVGTDSITGKAFDPQEGEQVEAGIKYLLPDNKGYLTIAYFDLEQSNLFEATATGLTQQSGINTVKGWELESKFFFGQLSIEANLSQLQTETQDGFQFESVPERQASTWLSYQLNNDIKTGLGVRYVGESYDGADTIKTPSYTLVDAMIAYPIEDWLLRLNLRNLADKEYQSTCLSRGDCFQGERRTIVGSISYRF